MSWSRLLAEADSVSDIWELFEWQYIITFSQKSKNLKFLSKILHSSLIIKLHFFSELSMNCWKKKVRCQSNLEPGYLLSTEGYLSDAQFLLCLYLAELSGQYLIGLKPGWWLNHINLKLCNLGKTCCLFFCSWPISGKCQLKLIWLTNTQKTFLQV